jgi:hypothetical protein
MKHEIILNDIHWQMSLSGVFKSKRSRKMSIRFKDVQKCVIAVIRKLCFDGTDLTDKDILEKKLSELPLDANSSTPGISFKDELISALHNCVPDGVNLKQEEKIDWDNWTIKNLAQYVYIKIKGAR